MVIGDLKYTLSKHNKYRKVIIQKTSSEDIKRHKMFIKRRTK